MKYYSPEYPAIFLIKCKYYSQRKNKSERDFDVQLLFYDPSYIQLELVFLCCKALK